MKVLEANGVDLDVSADNRYIDEEDRQLSNDSFDSDDEDHSDDRSQSNRYTSSPETADSSDGSIDSEENYKYKKILKDN